MRKKEKTIATILVLLCFLIGGVSWYFFHSSPVRETLKEDSQAVGYNPNLKKPKNFTSKQSRFARFFPNCCQRGK